MRESEETAIELHVDLNAWGKLDDLSLLANQSYNLGTGNHWFGAFRGGWYGMRMRIWGFQRHYFESHNWIPRHGLRLEHEYHLATMLFQMDSSIECMVYAANGLGNAFASSDFYDVSSHAALRRVAPKNVLEPPAKGVVGYEKHFPRFTKLLRQFKPLIDVIMENHDVSKHREMNLPGGKARMDPPPGFYEAHGVNASDPRAFFLAPMERTLLVPEPKAPLKQKLTVPRDQPLVFEHVAELYAAFMSAAGIALLTDASSAIHLNERSFRR